MSTAQAATFACEACGKTYKWKPQFAGKKLKCACGNIMQPAAPAAPRAPVPAISSQNAGRDIQVPAAGTAGNASCPSCSSAVQVGAAICVNSSTCLAADL